MTAHLDTDPSVSGQAVFCLNRWLAAVASDGILLLKFAMRRDPAIQILQHALPRLKQQYCVQDLAIFGSVARDEAGPESDVDILVTFEGPATFDGFMGLDIDLAGILGRKVDLVTNKALKPLMRPSVEKDLVHVP